MSLKFAKEPKATCFAYNKEKKRCNALSELVCSYKDECAFYKHKDDVDMKEVERAIRNYIPMKEGK